MHGRLFWLSGDTGGYTHFQGRKSFILVELWHLTPQSHISEMWWQMETDTLAWLRDLSSHFFCLHGSQLSGDAVLLMNSTCTGRLCDRHIVDAQGTCGSYMMSRNTGNTMSFALTCSLSIYLSQSLSWSNCLGPHFVTSQSSCSLQPSLVTSSSHPTASLPLTTRRFTYCLKIEALISHINENGGWTVLGCHCLGTTKDTSISGTDDTQVISQKVSMHFERVTPTDLSRKTSRVLASCAALTSSIWFCSLLVTMVLRSSECAKRKVMHTSPQVPDAKLLLCLCLCIFPGSCQLGIIFNYLSVAPVLVLSPLC